MNAVIDSINMTTQIRDVELWHKGLGHVNYKILHKLESKELVYGIPQLKKECRLLCSDCQVGKMTRVKHMEVGGHHNTTYLGTSSHRFVWNNTDTKHW